jgi:hypothetical protein
MYKPEWEGNFDVDQVIVTLFCISVLLTPQML